MVNNNGTVRDLKGFTIDTVNIRRTTPCTAPRILNHGGEGGGEGCNVPPLEDIQGCKTDKNNPL